MAESIKRFLKNFWVVGVSMAGIVGLYLEALPDNLRPAFVVVVATALVAAGARPTISATIEIGTRYRQYHKLLRQIGDLTQERDEKKEHLDEMRDEARASFDRGVTEGAARMQALVLANTTESPRLVALKVLEDGSLILVCKYTGTAPPIESRFDLAMLETDDKLGSLAIREIIEEKSSVHLYCIDETSPQFWSKLTERALAEPAPPAGVILAPYTASAS